MSLRQWRKTQDAVLTSAFLTLRAYLRRVARQRRGNAVLIASTAALFGEAGHADYASAKAGMAYGLTLSLKNEIARIAPRTERYCGGRVNCVCPGWTLVPRTGRLLGGGAASPPRARCPRSRARTTWRTPPCSSLPTRSRATSPGRS